MHINSSHRCSVIKTKINPHSMRFLCVTGSITNAVLPKFLSKSVKIMGWEPRP